MKLGQVHQGQGALNAFFAHFHFYTFTRLKEVLLLLLLMHLR